MPVAPPPATAAQTPVLPALTPVETPPETTSATPTITAAAPVPPVETLTAEAEDDAPRLSQRPQRRDPERAAEAAKKAKPKPQPKPKPKQTTRGNAKRDNTKGAQTAARAGNAAQSGTRQRAAVACGQRGGQQLSRPSDEPHRPRRQAACSLAWDRRDRLFHWRGRAVGRRTGGRVVPGRRRWIKRRLASSGRPHPSRARPPGRNAISRSRSKVGNRAEGSALRDHLIHCRAEQFRRSSRSHRAAR